MEVFLSLMKPRSNNKIISKLYNAIQLSKQGNTEYIKKKWEEEIQIKITQESWEKICHFLDLMEPTMFMFFGTARQ